MLTLKLTLTLRLALLTLTLTLTLTLAIMLMLMLTLALMPTRTLTLTHRKETTLSLCLGTSHQQVSPQWHFTHCASTAPDPNTGPVAHGQSIDFPRWHFC